MIPLRVTLVVCPVCERQAFSNTDLKPGHYARGQLCEGTPESVLYVCEAAAREKVTGITVRAVDKLGRASAPVSVGLGAERDRARRAQAT